MERAYETLDAERDLALAEGKHERARAEYAAARDAEFTGQVVEHERVDAADVAALAWLLQQAATIERRRGRRLVEFEDRCGCQYAGEAGGWPELVDESSGDASRLDRWLAWARERRASRSRSEDAARCRRIDPRRAGAATGKEEYWDLAVCFELCR